MKSFCFEKQICSKNFEGSVELLTPLTNNLFYNQENMQSSNFLLTTMIAAHFVE